MNNVSFENILIRSKVRSLALPLIVLFLNLIASKRTEY